MSLLTLIPSPVSTNVPIVVTPSFSASGSSSMDAPINPIRSAKICPPCVSVAVQKFEVYLHPDLEFWTLLTAITRTDLDYFHRHKNVHLGINEKNVSIHGKLITHSALANKLVPWCAWLLSGALEIPRL